MKESNQWAEYRKRFEEHMSSTTRPDFRHPWKWSTVVATMFVGQGEIVAKELKEIRAAGIQAACSWSTDPEDCPNLIHQRHHLWQWEKANPHLKINQLKTIFEVGAGYGAMVIIASRLGFRGKYNILDLPELEQIQRQHLAFRDIKCKLKFRERRAADLFIAISSISEIPIPNRSKFMDRLRPKSYLIAYQPDWGDDDNRAYFRDWAQTYRDNGGPPYMIFNDGREHDWLISTMEPQ